MDLEPPLQKTCTVSGVLSIILHISRIACIAPLKFESVRNGWAIRISAFYHFYSIVIQLSMLALASVFTFGRGDFVDGDEVTTYGEETTAMRVVGICGAVMFDITSIPLVFTGYNRMRYTVDCLANLQQVNEELDRFLPQKPQSDLKKYCVILLSFTLGYITVGVDYGGVVYEQVTASGYLRFESGVLIVMYLVCLQQQLYAIQFGLVVLRVRASIERLNSILQNFLDEMRTESAPIPNSSRGTGILVRRTPKRNDFDNTINNYAINQVIDLIPVIVKRGSKTNPETINTLAVQYCILCDMVKHLDRSNGPAMVMVLMFQMTYLISSPYYIFSVLFRGQSEDLSIYRAVSLLLWFVFCFSTAVLAVEPCHQTHGELEQTKDLVHQMSCYVHPEALGVMFELKQFSQHIELNVVSFSPMQFFTYDRGLLAAMLTTIATYLTVMISL